VETLRSGRSPASNDSEFSGERKRVRCNEVLGGGILRRFTLGRLH